MSRSAHSASPVKLDWQSAESAAAYKESRRPERFKRYQREETILSAWLGGLPEGATILDAPCGTGRWISSLLPRGIRYVGGDVSLAMIAQAQLEAGGDARHGFVNLEMEHLPFADNSVDCLIIWRFLHHVTNATTRLQVLREAARVSRDRVVLSFHHPMSLTFLRKSFDMLTGRKLHRGQAVSHWQLKREAESCGLRMAETRAFRFLSINWVALLRKG